MAEEPEVIFLQYYDEDGVKREGEDLSWCEDEINESDTKYIRADVVQTVLLKIAAIAKKMGE